MHALCIWHPFDLCTLLHCLCTQELGPRAAPVTPLSWTLPSQHCELMQYLKGINRPSHTTPPAAGGDVAIVPETSKVVFIVKPAAGLQGHGISVTANPMEAAAARDGKNTVVQHYIDPPMWGLRALGSRVGRKSGYQAAPC